MTAGSEQPVRSVPANCREFERRALPESLLGAAVHYPGGGAAALSECATERWSDHERRYGHRPVLTASTAHALLCEIDTAGLTGRGGGHFATAAKWRRVHEA